MITIIPLNTLANEHYFGLHQMGSNTVWLYDCMHMCLRINGYVCCVCGQFEKVACCSVCEKIK